jgi:transcriptional regulator with XRE-family HTH domain
MGDGRVFWANVFTVLKHQGRSVEYLATRLGVSHSLLYRWKDGSRTSSAAYRRHAADILGVPEALLFLPTVLPVSSATLHEDSEELAEVAS